MYILVHNNHVEKMNCNEKTFQQVIFDIKKQHEGLEVSPRFPIFKADRATYKTIFITELNDIVKHVVNNEEKIRYIPELIFKDETIKGIHFKINECQYIVQYSNMAPDTIHAIDEDDFNLFTQYNNYVSEWLLNEKFVSKFDEEMRTILDNYEVSPLTASLELESRNNLIGIGTIKAYTSNLHELDYIPVFNVFDRFVEFDEQEIEDYTMYLTRFEDTTETRISVANFAVVYGQHLKQ